MPQRSIFEADIRLAEIIAELVADSEKALTDVASTPHS